MTAAESTSNAGYGRQYPTLQSRASGCGEFQMIQTNYPRFLGFAVLFHTKTNTWDFQHVAFETIICFKNRVNLVFTFNLWIEATETGEVKRKIDGSNKATVRLDFLLQHSWLPPRRPMTSSSFNKRNLVIMTHHQLLMACAGLALSGSMLMLRWLVNSASEE